MKRLNELQVQNDYLAQQVHLLKYQLDEEIKSRLEVAENLDISQLRQGELQEQLQKVHRRENYFRDVSMRYAQGLSKLLPVILELQEHPPVTENGFV